MELITFERRKSDDRPYGKSNALRLRTKRVEKLGHVKTNLDIRKMLRKRIFERTARILTGRGLFTATRPLQESLS